MSTQEDVSQGHQALTIWSGMIKDTTRYPSALYKGERVYFCTRACLRIFKTDPDRFIAVK